MIDLYKKTLYRKCFLLWYGYGIYGIHYGMSIDYEGVIMKYLIIKNTEEYIIYKDVI